MEFQFRFEVLAIRFLVLIAATVFLFVFSLLIIREFVVGTIVDPRSFAGKPEIVSAAAWYPDSFRLQLLLAQSELTEISDHDENLIRAEAAVQRAVTLSPSSFEARMLLATTRELRGDRPGAETALRNALSLAPHNTQVHWKLANLLVREGKLDDAIPHFRTAVSRDKSQLSGMLDLLWDVTDGDASRLEAATSPDAASRLHLVSYLFQKDRLDDAARVYRGIDRAERREAPESSAYLNALISTGQSEMAHSLWLDLMGTRADRPAIWNGSFENDPVDGLTHFDWNLASNKYATINIDTDTAKSGGRSMRVEFTGIDTTRIDGEIRQLIPVEPGLRYRLEWYVRAASLNTPAGPRIYVTAINVAEPLAVSDPIESGDRDWRRMSLEFVAPADVKTVTVALKRIPRFNYDEPTTGVIWLDDFKMGKI